MRHPRNSNPEWGYYVAPAPNFLRTARVFVVAVALGAMASAAVVFSLMDRPSAETSVAARSLVQSVELTLPVRSVPLAAQSQTQSKQASLSQTERDAADADSPASGTTTTHRPPVAAALAEAPRIVTTEAPPGGVLASESNIAATSEAAAAAPAPTPAPRKTRAAARRYDVPRYTRRYDSMERGPYASLRRYGSYGQEY
jgi:hypothetical protein